MEFAACKALPPTAFFTYSHTEISLRSAVFQVSCQCQKQFSPRFGTGVQRKRTRLPLIEVRHALSDYKTTQFIHKSVSLSERY